MKSNMLQIGIKLTVYMKTLELVRRQISNNFHKHIQNITNTLPTHDQHTTNKSLKHK